MAQVVDLRDVQSQREQKTGRSGLPYWRTSFVTPQGDDDPQAYMIENSPAMTIASHFHDVDQYQVFVKGEGAIGRKDVAPVAVHFARAFTTYGPIESRGEGLGWVTLRPRRDLGAKMIDTHRETLLERRDRQPWQTTVPVDFGAATSNADGAEVIAAPGGLSARAVALRAGEERSAGDPAATPCQYILVTGGSLLHEGRECGALTVIHVPPTDAPFRLAAGAQGLRCLVLDFSQDSVPRGVKADAAAGRHAEPGSVKEADQYHCELCGFVYEVAEGLPAQGIAPGTPWSAIPEGFQCPDCAAGKHDFVPVEF